jgi:hypothetical protein
MQLGIMTYLAAACEGRGRDRTGHANGSEWAKGRAPRKKAEANSRESVGGPAA